jgi:gliding motility-associated-like protein
MTMAQYELTDTEAEITGEVTDLLCNGIPTGAIDVTITGTVVEPLVTSWTGPDGFIASTDDIADLSAGAYTITITDDATCVFTQDFEVLQPDTIDVSVITDSVSCAGGADGAIDIEPSGATPDYTYLWTGPGGLNEVTQDISGLEAGDYDLIITDENDCVYPLQIEVEAPTPISTTALILDADCFSDSTGAIDISITGGTPDYSVTWTGPGGFTATSEDINDVPAGDYIAQVTDGNGCPIEQTYSVDEPLVISVSIVESQDSDCDVPTGFIAVQAQEGTPGYDYLWTDDGGAVLSTDTLVEDLGPGVYTLAVTDANGCSITQDFTISTSDATLEGLLTDLDCNGIPTGAIDLSIIGEVSDPFILDWDGPSGFDSDQEDISSLEAGDYIVTITDAQNCVFTESFTIEQPDTLQVSSNEQDVLCFGGTEGAIDITPLGGVPDYGFSWTGPEGDLGDSEDIQDLAAGTYLLTLTDDNGCLFEFETDIEQPDSIIIFGSVSDPSCLGLEDGSIDIQPQGGTVDYDFQWTGPDGFSQTTEDIGPLAPGDYDLSLTDANGCVKDTTITLLGNQVIAFTSASLDVTCNGVDDGSISTTVTGGTPDYSFDWSGPDGFFSSDPDITDLGGGDYILSLADDNGCTLDTTIIISEPDTLLLSDLVIADIDCNGDGDGSISLTMTGGSPDLIFSWTGPDAFTADTEDITDLDGGAYDLIVTDANDCEYAQTFDLDEPDILTINLDTSSDALCENETDGEIAVTIEGGTADFSYSWTGPDGFLSDSEDLVDIAPGDYLLLVTDANGCTDDLQAEVGFAIEIEADAGSYSGVCNGSEITFDGSASTGLGSYGWSTPNGPTFSTLATATAQVSHTNHTFILTITNSTCVDSDTLVLDVLQLPEPDAGEDAEVFFEEGILLGGDPTWGNAFSFDWSPGEGLDDPTAANPFATITATTTFVVTVVDLNGCVGADAVTITLDPEVDIFDGFTPNGDDSNELWQIGNREQFPEMEVQIFNRWGDELFQSAPGYPIPWDGTYEGGDLPVGTYYYVIELNDPRFPDPITGPVTIFR